MKITPAPSPAPHGDDPVEEMQEKAATTVVVVAEG